MDETRLKRGYRNAWILVALSALFVVAFFYLTWRANTPARPEAWDMGGTPFVPASHAAAEGYPVPAGEKR